MTHRIGVVGCGALGSFYGARIWKTGREVHFLLRSDYEAVREQGARILDASGGVVARPHAARRPEEIGPCDLVLVALKTTANHALRELLPPLIGPSTAVLTLQNGLGNEECLADIVGAERVFGGLCFVCLNRVEPGVVRHVAHGRIVLGEHGRAASKASEAMVAMFREAGVPCDLTNDLQCAHWEKLVWNIPFNGLGVASAAGIDSVERGKVLDPDGLGPCLATDALLADERWCRLVLELMRETIHSARLQGLNLPDSAAEEQMERTRQMGCYRASTLVDFERRLPLELESLFGEPLRRATAAGYVPPRLSALYSILKELDALRTSTVPLPP